MMPERPAPRRRPLKRYLVYAVNTSDTRALPIVVRLLKSGDEEPTPGAIGVRIVYAENTRLARRAWADLLRHGDIE
jgi:hypothetical protein